MQKANTAVWLSHYSEFRIQLISCFASQGLIVVKWRYVTITKYANSFSPDVRKTDFCMYGKSKDVVTTRLVSTFFFATQIVHSLSFLNPKFQASNHLMWLHSPVCVGSGQKSRRPIFSQRGSIHQNFNVRQTKILKYLWTMNN